MNNTIIQLTEDEFDERYSLVVNTLNPNASWCFDDGPGCLFETYGKELEFVRRQDPCTVWTLLDGDDGDQYLTSGFHFVNRIGYLVSTVAVPAGVNIEVHIPTQPDPAPDPDEPDAATTEAEPRLAAIAREHLGITTLETRRSDALDFHEVSVWGVKDALRHAYQAGKDAGPEQPGQIQKQLTSNGMFHTPGIFRALQNDYRIRGNPRRHAIKTLMNGYGLAREEATGLLSGAIRSEIDDTVGTVTFTSQWGEATVGTDREKNPYSVLLLYPDYADDTGYETYYALVEAANADEAVEAARREAVAAQEGIEIEPDHFHPLLVTSGHHDSEALFNK